MEASGDLKTASAFLWGNNRWYTLDRKLSGPPRQRKNNSDEEKNLLPPRTKFDLPISSHSSNINSLVRLYS
jgi:hypothetical protein